MAIYASLTKAYSQAIYIDGTKKFSDIRAEYVVPVKKYAATNYTDVQIAESLDSGYITQQEYDDTIAYKTF